MKARTVVALTLMGIVLSGCAKSRVFEGVEYKPYGVVNEQAVKNEKVCYVVSAGSVIVGVIFVESVIAPMYVFGWDLMEPIRLKRIPEDKC